MSRYSRIGLILVLLVILGIGLWWLREPDAPYPTTRRVEALQDTSVIRWTPEGVAAIDAQGPLDALSTLGYVHGMTRGWTAVLWRRTARGRLSRWFGTGLVSIDRFTRRLGFAQKARAAYEQLPAAYKRRLRAYSQGLTAALQSPQVRRQDPFVLHDVTPARWEPWHTLAVERLLAWLATSPLASIPEAPPSVTDFRRADQQLRRWLHLHGWDRSVAWAVRASTPADSSRTLLFQRHVLGASARPIFQEIVLDRPGAPRLTGPTLPGVPLMPSYTLGDEASASLLRSSSSIERVPFDESALQQRYERLSPSNGDEHLLWIRRLDGAMVLEHDSSRASPAPDSTERPRPTQSSPSGTAWVLRWPGLSTVSDLPAWLHRAGLSPPSDDTASFQLFKADGLHISSTGRWTVLGSPSVVVRDSATQQVTIGHSVWARRQAQSLRGRRQADARVDVERWSASDSSAWAAALGSHLEPALDRFVRTHPQFRNVATYLRNWDHVYDPSSIGATLFDQWMRAYRADLGHVPTLSDSSAYFGTYRRHRALLRALDTLRTQFGSDVRRWRWERAVPDRRFFPVWSADSLVEASLQDLSTTQYAPLERSGLGHPSALSGGPSLVDPPPTAPSPTTWEGWASPRRRGLTVRRHHYDPSALFARSRLQRGRPIPVPLIPASDSVSHTTILFPARP